jgi:phage terminase Nu1 subunit (DNA packaging protein)
MADDTAIEDLVVTSKQLASLLGVTDRRVQQLANDGTIPKAKRGSYPLGPCIRGYVEWLKAGQDEAATADGKKQLEQLRIEKLTLELAREKRQLVEWKVVRRLYEQRLGVLATAVRTLGGQLAVKLGPMLAAPNTPSEVKRLTDDHLRLALSNLEDVPRDAPSDEPSDD